MEIFFLLFFFSIVSENGKNVFSVIITKKKRRKLGKFKCVRAALKTCGLILKCSFIFLIDELLRIGMKSSQRAVGLTLSSFYIKKYNLGHFLQGRL